MEEWDRSSLVLKSPGCFSKPKRKGVPLTKILRLLPRVYLWHMVIGTISAILHGGCFPGFAIAFGKLFDIFVPSPTATTQSFREGVATICYAFIALGAWAFLWGYICQLLWGSVGESIGEMLRMRVFSSMMIQEVGWFDQQPSGRLVSILSDDIALVRLGLGDKVATYISFMSQCLIGVIVALVFSWKLALVMIATTPLTAASQAIRARVLAKASHVQSDTNAGASSLAAEVIGSFRTVVSFDWQDEAVRRYALQLQQTRNSSRKEVHVNGVVFGLSYLLMFWVNALIFWYGSTLVLATPANGGITQGDFIIVFMSVLMSAMGLGQAVAISPDFARSRGAAANLYDVMNRVPLIDANPTGVKEVLIAGAIELGSVVFRYPARPDTLVLDHVSLKIAPGSVIAFVGRSGVGKSTIISLVERFYDVDEGFVHIDGRNIKDYDVHWLRRQIGLVSQEPLLFDMTIAENILFGCPHHKEISRADVEAAAKTANAHDFIMKLDEGYETCVGERGAQMSGGQKQRIAIARAILKNPAILLLDEATSALDSESEALVQEALETLMKGRTTIIIAHRLSTIRHADVICVMEKGQIVEMGSHDALIAKQGPYYDLVAHQMQ